MKVDIRNRRGLPANEEDFEAGMPATAWAVFQVPNSEIDAADLSDTDVPIGTRIDGSNLDKNGSNRLELAEGVWELDWHVPARLDSEDVELTVELHEHGGSEIATSTPQRVGDLDTIQAPSGRAFVKVGIGETLEVKLRTGSGAVDGALLAGSGGLLRVRQVRTLTGTTVSTVLNDLGWRP